MNNRIRTHHDRDITIHRNIIQILYISLIAFFTQLVKFYILVSDVHKYGIVKFYLQIDGTIRPTYKSASF